MRILKYFATLPLKMFNHNSAIMNPFLYALSLDNHGDEVVNSIVGQESSGAQYNVIRLDQDGKPHNAMGNSGP